jgi:hypothetical protein
MNCADCEQLFDAYLDGHLAGSLRLEFDAHRLRCRHCQQTLAMLEALGNVIASDPQIPELQTDFTDRVMQRVRPHRGLRPSLRVVVAAGAVLQAAAVLGFAILLNRHPATTPAPLPARGETVQPNPYPPTAGNDALRKLILDRIEERLSDMHAAGETLTSDFVNMARYLNITVPDDVARDSVQMAGTNPWQGIWNALMPSGAEEEPPAPPDADVHSF